MYIKHVELTQFRNYENIQFDFENKINVVIGENAQGKTNLVESIYMLALANSHRTSKSQDVIMWEQDFSKISGIVEKENNTIPLELIVSKKGKRGKVNHLNQTKISQYVGHLNAVMFAPEDLNIVKGSPQIRRKFLDTEISQISPIYLHDLNQYLKVLKEKNSLLKMLQTRKTSDTTMLDIYNEQLALFGAKIIEKRLNFLEKLRKRSSEIHKEVSRERETLDIQYESTLGELKLIEDSDLRIAQLEEKFDKMKVREIERGASLIGVQRDDLIFTINGKNVQTFGSQGQQRTTALSLKISEIELIKEETKEYPVLLLDDVLSELDDYRQSQLLETIKGKVQTFITTTSIDGIHHETLKSADEFRIENGILL